MEEIKTKRCVHCGKELPIEMFCKASKTKDGYQPWCKPCTAEYHRERKMQKEALKEAAQHAANLAPTDADRIVTADGKAYRKVEQTPAKELKDYTARELLAELKSRGYIWENLWIKQSVDWCKI